MTTFQSSPATPLTGRFALVTGSTSGIGAATAVVLAARGARVLVTGRDHQRGKAVVDAITEDGGQASFLPSDLTLPPDALRAFAAAATHALGGRLDLLVHNAAVCPAVDTLGLSETTSTPRSR